MELKEICVGQPNCKLSRYRFYMGDERILAPMAMFYPNMLGLIGTNVCKNKDRYCSDPADIHDEDYLMQTMSKHEQVTSSENIRTIGIWN